MAPTFKSLKLEDPLLARMQESIQRCLDFLMGRHDVDRRFLQDTGDGLGQGIALLAASTTLVAHGLGKAWTAWRVVGLKQNAVVYEDTATAAPATSHLALKCSANCTVKLEVW